MSLPSRWGQPRTPVEDCQGLASTRRHPPDPAGDPLATANIARILGDAMTPPLGQPIMERLSAVIEAAGPTVG
ncbi:hypothetical protein ACQW02_17790 [Humitalea sp. 24SJ18S-53]|uniref:hypothetical protein n=1 Tax=Humitalea sp. 24SJ18S-53 TaxID=3422307 RepID=UPI003D66CB8E